MNFLWLIAVALILIPIAYASAQTPTWDFCIAGDLTSTAVKDKMKALDCKVHVLTGDYYGKEDTFVGGFKEKGVPVLASCGNHDDCTEVSKQDNIVGDKTNYGIKYKNVGFIVVNTENKISKQEPEINRLMDKFQKDPTINHIVVSQHKATITNTGAHHGENEVSGDRELYTKMADQYPKFKYLFQGHNHGYQKCEPVSPDITVITEGTGGRTPYPWGSGTDDNCHDNLSGSKYTGFSIATVSPDSISIKHINVK
jgi:hypothetical protein